MDPKQYALNDIARLLWHTSDSTGQAVARSVAGTISAVRFDSDETGVITAATAANPVVITSALHGLSNGDKVLIENVAGMTEINKRTFTVASAATNTFALSGEDGSLHTAYSAGGTWQKVEVVTTGVTDFDAFLATGCQVVRVDTSLDPTFYVNNTRVGILLNTATIDAVTPVNIWIGDFYIDSRILVTVDTSIDAVAPNRFQFPTATTQMITADETLRSGWYAKGHRDSTIADLDGRIIGSVGALSGGQRIYVAGLTAAPTDGDKIFVSPMAW